MMVTALKYILAGTIFDKQRPVKVKFESSTRHPNPFVYYTCYDLVNHKEYSVQGRQIVSIRVYNVRPAII